MHIKFIQKNIWLLIILVLIIGSLLRIFLSTRGYNYDLQSYTVVNGILESGKNVYHETSRYNYGPVWFLTIGIIDNLSDIINPNFFRYAVSIFLTLVDIGIFALLFYMVRKLRGVVTAFFISTIFFLNPISIIITGYHSQFDNFAILLGLLSIIFYGDDFENKLSKRKYLGLILLGVSLVTKHIFFAFSFWLCLKQKGKMEKLIVLMLPILIFFFSFVPFLMEAKDEIIKNVFLYKSHNNAPFVNFILPKFLQFSPTILFILMLGIFGFIVRKKSSFESLLIYTIVITVFSPAIANQYFAIPIVAITYFINIPFVFYTLITTFYLCVDGNGLHYEFLRNISPKRFLYEYNGLRVYDLPILFLFIGLVFIFIRFQVIKRFCLSIYQKIKKEIQFQFTSL